MKAINILIIEDDSATANSIKDSLNKSGHSVTGIARSLSTALTSFNTTIPDLLLVDTTMARSGEDGIEIAKALVDIYGMPIIYLSGDSDPGIVARAKQTMPAAYLLKPIRPEELTIQIELAYYRYLASQPKLIDPIISDIIYLPAGKGYVKVVKNDVSYIKAHGAYIEIFTRNSKTSQVFSTHLGHILQYFPLPDFYRVSRSIIVNLKCIDRIELGYFYANGDNIAVDYPENAYGKFKNQLPIVKTPSKKSI